MSMQAVFCFVEDLRGMCFKHIGGDFFAAVRGQAMLHHAVRMRDFHEVFVDLIAFEDLAARRRLFFLTHRSPHVGEDDIRVRGGFFAIGVMRNLSPKSAAKSKTFLSG